MLKHMLDFFLPVYISLMNLHIIPTNCENKIVIKIKSRNVKFSVYNTHMVDPE